jgi:hypothetical protein
LFGRSRKYFAFVLLSNARATGKTASLFEASARNDFASLYEIADSGEGLGEEALEIFVEARALADEYSAKMGAKQDWEVQIKRIVRRRAKNAKRSGQALSPLDFSLADEFIRRNSGHIFREKRSDRVYLWDKDEREWVVDDRIKPFVVAFLKDCAATNAAEQETLLPSAKLSTIYVLCATATPCRTRMPSSTRINFCLARRGRRSATFGSECPASTTGSRTIL